MNPSITLTAEELKDITGLIRPAAQQRWFKDNMGIEATRRADGSLSVPRALYMQKAGIKPAEKKPELRLANAS